MQRTHLLPALLLTTLGLAFGTPASAVAATGPVALAAAVCADHPNQASAQRAKDTP